MATIEGWIHPNWHERYLIVRAPSKRPMRTTDLLANIMEEQGRRIGLRGMPMRHCPGNHKKVSEHRKRWVVEERGSVLALTPLGRWIANSRLATLTERDKFVQRFICPLCFKPPSLALLRPLPQTAEVNARGDLFTDSECPVCGYTDPRMSIGKKQAVNDFIVFYNAALARLERTAKVKGRLLERDSFRP
ncbi:MAG: hypothetical protein JW753_10235 [Dehalococcoidia bacterium]|nr:hypothetical protein [Dehalococcoidia bacterium]